MPQRWPRALAYAALIWVVGFAWGSVVFMTPGLKAVPPIPYVSSNPAISFPILLVWLPLAYLLARSYLRTAPSPGAEGLRLGSVFAEVNLLLDVLVLVVALQAGWGYFASASVWLGYALLLIVPWWVGRAAQAGSAATAGR